jgi:hypothetical protein
MLERQCLQCCECCVVQFVLEAKRPRYALGELLRDVRASEQSCQSALDEERSDCLNLVARAIPFAVPSSRVNVRGDENFDCACAADARTKVVAESAPGQIVTIGQARSPLCRAFPSDVKRKRWREASAALLDEQFEEPKRVRPCGLAQECP